MPATVPGLQVIVTKNATTGNFNFLVQSPSGALRLAFSLLSADMATAAALTSGNSATLTYGQDGVNPTGPTKTDFPVSYVQETF